MSMIADISGLLKTYFYDSYKNTKPDDINSKCFMFYISKDDLERWNFFHN